MQSLIVAFSEAVTLQQVADAVVVHGLDALDAHLGMVALLINNGQTLRILNERGLTAEIPRHMTMNHHSPLTDAVRQGQMLWISSFEEYQQRYPELAATAGESRAGISIPLQLHGQMIGGIMFNFSSTRHFDQEERDFFALLAHYTAQAIDRARLYEAESRARAHVVEILESIGDAFYTLDQDWRFTYINRKTEQFWNRDRRSLIGKNMWEAFPEVVGTHPYHEFHRAMREQQVIEFETFSPIIHRWLSISVYPNPGGMSVYFRDIQERKEAEATHRETEQRMRMMVETAKDYAIFSMDKVGNVTSWNTGAERVFGYTEQEILHQSADIVYTPEDQMAGIPETERKQAAENGFANDDRWHMQKNGNRIFVSGTTRPLIDASGTLTGFVKIGQDITERRQAEERYVRLLYEQQEAVRQREEALALLNALFSAAPIGIAFFDRQLRYQRVSEGLAKINGLPIEAHIGRTPFELFPDIPPEVTEGRLRYVLETGEAIQFETSGRTPATGDELHHWLLVNYPVRLNDEVIGIGALLLDITERKRVEEERTELLEREKAARADAQNANELKMRILAIVSHELRTPLTSIRGFADTLLAEDVTYPPETQREFLEVIAEESDRMNGLIDQLLDYSSLEAGKLTIRPETQPIEVVFGTAMTQLETLTQNHGLNFNIPSNLPEVHADAQRAAQVLVNLVGNAVKYSPKGKQITISAYQEDSAVQVNVSDQGPGIPTEARAYVFDAFRRIDNPSLSQKGVGLGLAIARGIVEAHGGRIWVQDTPPGTGTTISFTLPIAG